MRLNPPYADKIMSVLNVTTHDVWSHKVAYDGEFGNDKQQQCYAHWRFNVYLLAVAR